MYVVRCEHPRSADVIFRSGPVVESRHDSLNDALSRLRSWYIPGPNGPARSAVLMRDGFVVDAHDECRRIGVKPIYQGSHIAGCRTAEHGEDP